MLEGEGGIGDLDEDREGVGPIYRGKKNDFAMKFLKVSVTKPLENHQSVKYKCSLTLSRTIEALKRLHIEHWRPPRPSKHIE